MLADTVLEGYSSRPEATATTFVCRTGLPGALQLAPNGCAPVECNRKPQHYNNCNATKCNRLTPSVTKFAVLPKSVVNVPHKPPRLATLDQTRFLVR